MDEETATATLPKENADRRIHQALVRRNSRVCRPVASRYLREPVGSCHDFCKHGTERRKLDSSLRKKSADSVNGGGIVSSEVVGNRESGETVPKLRNGREEGPLLISVSDLKYGCNHRRRITMRRVNSMGLVLTAGKARSNVLDAGDSLDTVEGKVPKEAQIRTSGVNLVNDDDTTTSLLLSSAKKKPNLPMSLPERKNTGQSRSGGNLTRARLLLPMSPSKSASVRGKTEDKDWKVLASDNKDSPSKKLSIRRGKPLERLSDNVSPLRLKFTRPILQESQNSSRDTGRKEFRKAEPNGTEVKLRKQERVALRHRAVKKRQEGHCLFNNMIGETASKLVKARKGKVKALVGAFETVISLQDNKKVQATATVC